MQKRILFGKEAREKLLKGVNTLADAVSVTLGYSGKNVLIGGSFVENYNTYHLPTRVTKDGISVAREIYLDDPIENRGALLLREASQKTMTECGDGTTTSVVMARAIVVEGMKLIEQGANSVELKRNIDAAVEIVLNRLKELATPVSDDIEKIRHIATIAANNDSSIGDLIAEAFSKIGNDGVINIQESLSDKTEIKITEGVKVDNGWLVPNFNTNKPKNECELNDPIIVLYEKTISKISQIKKIVEYANQQRRPIFFCCNDMDGEALAFLIVNTQSINGKMPALPGACVIKNPSFGSNRIDEMEDLAISVGGTFISELKGLSLEKMSMSMAGSAEKVIISKDQTIIVGGGKSKDEFDEYLANLQMNRVGLEGDEKEKIEKRIARLTGGIAVISVGGATEVEMKERRDRVDDSIRATKSAIAEGYVPGAGTSFVKIGSVGNDIVNVALLAPLRQICENAGQDAAMIVNEVQGHPNKNMGYNVKSGCIEDLVIHGVIDPIKVLRNCIINAASVATMILTSEAVIVDVY